jgi:acyl-CoA thioester hydrolase
MIEVWRGSVATWECDSMGHMNIRFYVSRAMEGLAHAALGLGLGEIFAVRSTSTLLVREHHIRFLKEARADAPLHMEAGVVSMGETDAVLLQVLRHSVTGEPAASFVTTVVHASPGERQPFPWPGRARREAERLMTGLPDYAGPRGIDVSQPGCAGSLALAEKFKIPCGCRGAVMPEDCDAFGRMRPEAAMARMSDGMMGPLQRLTAAVGETAPELLPRLGGVALEYRLVYRQMPHTGAPIDIRSNSIGYTAKLRRARHWLLDPITGQPFAAAEVLAANFDLEARKVMAIPQAALDKLAGYAKPDVPL